MREVVIVGGARAPIGSFLGALASVHAMSAHDATTAGASLCIGGGEAITVLVER